MTRLSLNSMNSKVVPAAAASHWHTDNRYRLFLYRLNIIFSGVMNEGIIVIAEFIFGRNPAGAERPERLQQLQERRKAHNGAIPKLINFPALALLHIPCSYTWDHCCEANRMTKEDAFRHFTHKMADLKWSYMKHCLFRETVLLVWK